MDPVDRVDGEAVLAQGLRFSVGELPCCQMAHGLPPRSDKRCDENAGPRYFWAGALAQPNIFSPLSAHISAFWLTA